MKTIIKAMCLLTISIFCTTQLFPQSNSFFTSRIKGKNCEYNVQKNTYSSSITISNVNNTWGTDKFPGRVLDYGQGMTSKDDYVKIYKIIKNSLGTKDFGKLLDSEKFQTRNFKIRDKKAREKLQEMTMLCVYVVYYPSGEVFEVYFGLSGKILQAISPDYYCEIEKQIKEKIQLEKLRKIDIKAHLLCRYEYHFNDLDSKEFDGEKVILSNIK
ncbi:MAG: hypothetical protein VB022_04490 [Rikenellaceae bacterium]|nr:hypothetical protein [Rikenellaceae bacterium]